MAHKKLIILITISLLAALTIMAFNSGLKVPLSQMDMPTDTMVPGTPVSSATPAVQVTPAPLALTPTSIFTGFTPPPTGAAGMNGSMSSCGSGCGSGMGSSAGMSGMGSMGMSGTAVITGTMTSGMGTGSMEMGGCPMMSMGGAGMSASGMTGMGSMSSGDDLLMSGMDMDEIHSAVVYDPPVETTNPWIILGWVLLGLVGVAIIAAVIISIILIVRGARPTHPA